MERNTTSGLFSDSEFTKIWTVGLLSGIIRWLELLAFGIYGYDVTGSAALVALLVVLRFLPLALFGVFLGALSDLFSPRKLMIIGLIMVMATSGIMLTLFWTGQAEFWHVAVAAFVSGIFWASDFPFRRKMIGDRVAPALLSRSMALDNATSNGTRALGPLIGGAMYEYLGLDGVFALGAALYALSILVSLTIQPTAITRVADVGWARLTAPLKGSWEAARYAAQNRDVGIILLVTVVFNIWGFPYLAMIPVIGKDELGLDPSTVGAISALEGLFALIGALVLARITPPHMFRILYLGGVAVLFCFIILIGWFSGAWVLALGLSVGGFCTAGFAIMQSTLIYSVAPKAMTGRFLGLMTIAIGTGVIGFANIGLTAELVSASDALIIIGLEGLIPILALAWWWWRDLFKIPTPGQE